jgi:uncharacterized protein YbjT (DUF2867 family)
MTIIAGSTLKPTIAVVGANGFAGTNTVTALLNRTNYQIRAVVRDASKFKIVHPRLKVVVADISCGTSTKEALTGVKVAFYFVHSLLSDNAKIYEDEARVAENFATIAKAVGVERVIYLSGLGSDKQKLSNHLASRHNTGDIFRKHIPLTIEFRAGVIVGQGSISFEIIRKIINRLPVIILPTQAKTHIQPIGLPDVVSYLLASITVPIEGAEIIEIGAPNVFTYQTLLETYAKHLGKHKIIFSTKLLPLWLAGWCLYLFLPKEIARIGQNMVESFKNEMAVTNHRAQELFPSIWPKEVQEYFII